MTVVGLVMLGLAWAMARLCMHLSDEISTITAAIAAAVCLVIGLFLSPAPVLVAILFLVLVKQRTILWFVPVPRLNARS